MCGTTARRQTAGIAATLTTPAAGERLIFVDVMRLLAAVSVIWIHTPESSGFQGSRAIGNFPVPFFVIGSIYFLFGGLQRHPGRTFLEYAKGRLVKLYLPFVAWSILYLAVRNAKHALITNQPTLRLSGWDLLQGNAHHLWFLPFILLAGLAAIPVCRLLIVRPAAGWMLAAGFAAGGLGVALVSSEHLGTLGSVYFVQRAWIALPAVCWAVPFIVLDQKRPSLIRSSAASVAGLILLVAATASLWHSGHSTLIKTLAGLGAMLFSFTPMNGTLVRRLAALGPLTFGIYLSHILYVEGIQAVVHKAGLTATAALDVAILLATIILSTLTAALLHRSRWTRWLAP